MQQEVILMDNKKLTQFTLVDVIERKIHFTKTNTIFDKKDFENDNEGALLAYNELLADAKEMNENEFVSNLMVPAFWIGLTDKAEEGNFVWVNGSPLYFTNWGQPQPDNCWQEHYVEIRKNKEWNDLYYNARLPFVCELDNKVTDIKKIKQALDKLTKLQPPPLKTRHCIYNGHTYVYSPYFVTWKKAKTRL